MEYGNIQGNPMTPLTANDVVICPHQGKVILHSKKGKSLTFKDNIQAITKQDLLNAEIIGCTRTIAGVSVPCVKVASVDSCSNLLTINEDEIVLCEKLSSSLTDKGFSLSLQGEALLKNKVDIE